VNAHIAVFRSSEHFAFTCLGSRAAQLCRVARKSLQQAWTLSWNSWNFEISCPEMSWNWI